MSDIEKSILQTIGDIENNFAQIDKLDALIQNYLGSIHKDNYRSWDQAELAVFTKRLESYKRKTKRMESGVAKKHQEIVDAYNQNVGLEKDLDKQNEKINEYNRLIPGVKQSATRLEQSRMDYLGVMNQIVTLSLQKEKTKKELERVKMANSKKDDRIKEAQNQAIDVDKRLTETKEKFATKEKTLAQLKEENEAAKKTILASIADREYEEALTENLKFRNTLKQQAGNIKRAAQKYNEEFQRYDDVIDGYEKIYAQRNAELSQLDKQINEAKEMVVPSSILTNQSNPKEEIDAHKKVCEEKESQIKKLKAEMAEKGKSIVDPLQAQDFQKLVKDNVEDPESAILSNIDAYEANVEAQKRNSMTSTDKILALLETPGEELPITNDEPAKHVGGFKGKLKVSEQTKKQIEDMLKYSETKQLTTNWLSGYMGGQDKVKTATAGLKRSASFSGYVQAIKPTLQVSKSVGYSIPSNVPENVKRIYSSLHLSIKKVSLAEAIRFVKIIRGQSPVCGPMNSSVEKTEKSDSTPTQVLI
ncbi:hypothetical protein EIN_186630 [Entamoeba invadens IP1]|uniref:hypothetical protein n=1 Tax=Entamoeba invadens IP1 TaxID=370355 RepID=UPI0002C3CF42|nr:hypothetical protein EIN_186630 [Entamoeba invadens IP1]ELP94236.1 hypothetical protein EIN_186630 [Entamoeba invadens IP1]|eukprot:XP_004261007.1 hypothetical protein EIN_186630 [Entamoeba invadens IP1]